MSLVKPADYPFWFRAVVAITLAMFAVNLFFFLGPSIALITWVHANFSISGREFLGGIGTVVASFAGAWFAFRFAKFQRTQEREDDQVAAGNRALFTLIKMYNALRQHQKEVVDPYRDKSDAWLNLHVSQPLDGSLSFDMKELSFVMQAAATTFAEVLIEEERFRLAAFLVKEHRRVMLSEVWPRLEAAGIRVGENRPVAEIESIIGVSTVHTLKVITDAIIKNFDENVISSKRAFKKLRGALKWIYPNRKFVDFKPN